jgi:hypothetical protein
LALLHSANESAAQKDLNDTLMRQAIKYDNMTKEKTMDNNTKKEDKVDV